MVIDFSATSDEQPRRERFRQKQLFVVESP